MTTTNNFVMTGVILGWNWEDFSDIGMTLGWLRNDLAEQLWYDLRTTQGWHWDDFAYCFVSYSNCSELRIKVALILLSKKPRIPIQCKIEYITILYANQYFSVLIIIDLATGNCKMLFRFKAYFALKFSNLFKNPLGWKIL